ncbi:MAG: DUF4203 domain-containing protein [Acidobacteriota bacterium]
MSFSTALASLTQSLPELPAGIPVEPGQIVGLVLGAVLLVVGRRIFWLALAALGFVVLGDLARQLFAGASDDTQLVAAVIGGIAGALLAILAQRLAVAIGGVVLGAWAGLWLGATYAPGQDAWIVLLAAIGGLLGFALSKKLFAALLIIISAAVGASLLVGAIGLAPPWAPLVWLILVVTGVAVQSRGRRRRD